MKTTQTLALGTEQYIQGVGVTALTGKIASRICKKALVVAGSRAWQACSTSVAESLTENQVSYMFHPFSGYCSEKNVGAIVRAAQDADLVIGAGGGKCMDAVKSAAELTGLPYLLIPTSSATCASHVKLCVWYTDEGVCAPGMFASRSAEAVLVDTGIIGRAPSRLLASGMADALAKYPELDYSKRLAGREERTAQLEAAVAVAKNNIEMLIAHGPAAMMEVEQGIPGFHTDKVVSIAIGMTGLTSNLVAGVHQLAVAHMFHDGVASLYHDSRTKYLHGEVVSVGILLQMASNGYDIEYIDRVRQFLMEIKAPVCMSQLEIEPSQENRDILFDYIVSKGFDQPDMKRAIYDAFDTILK